MNNSLATGIRPAPPFVKRDRRLSATASSNRARERWRMSVCTAADSVRIRSARRPRSGCAPDAGSSETTSCISFSKAGVPSVVIPSRINDRASAAWRMLCRKSASCVSSKRDCMTLWRFKPSARAKSCAVSPAKRTRCHNARMVVSKTASTACCVSAGSERNSATSLSEFLPAKRPAS